MDALIGTSKTRRELRFLRTCALKSKPGVTIFGSLPMARVDQRCWHMWSDFMEVRK